MYEYLEGRVVLRSTTRLVIEVHGVAYDVAVPLGADFRPTVREDGKESVRVWTHFVVREDAHQLFGFPDTRARELFRLLLQVRGVGPSLAQAILSGLAEEELLGAIAQDDPSVLMRIRGVGKKTAEQILLDLRDRAPKPHPASAGDKTLRPASPASARSERMADAVRALLSIGYSENEARRSVERALEKVSSEDLEELVRTALHG